MTQDEIIEMAVKAGIAQVVAEVNIDIMKAFANLVAAKERENWPAEMKAMENQVNILTDELSNAVKSEREACAKIADEWSVGYPHPSTIIATAIRARGEQA